jgi:hypothetical protein
VHAVEDEADDDQAEEAQAEAGQEEDAAKLDKEMHLELKLFHHHRRS